MRNLKSRLIEHIVVDGEITGDLALLCWDRETSQCTVSNTQVVACSNKLTNMLYSLYAHTVAIIRLYISKRTLNFIVKILNSVLNLYMYYDTSALDFVVRTAFL